MQRYHRCISTCTADGGDAETTCGTQKGGSGANVALTFDVGSGANMIAPGAQVRFVVGGAGASDGSSILGSGVHYSGGGGGTGVLYRPTTSSSWELLTVAGGGGGSYLGMFAGFCVDEIGGQGGRSGESGGNGNGDFSVGSGGSSGNGGGGGDVAGGGGGANSAGGGTACTPLFTVQEGGAGGNNGGHGGTSEGCPGFATADGGFGYGGGGGGYSGGGAGGTIGRGGGGSYAAGWATSGLKFAGSNGGGNENNGYVQYQFTLNNPPVANCKNATKSLNSSGNATISTSDVDNGSSDPDNDALSLSVSPSSFTCANVGSNTVTLTVSDGSTSSTCTATVTIQDNTNPSAQCQNVTVQLNSAGNGSTSAAAVNNGSSDACGLASSSVSPSSFTCSNVGANTVTLTVTDVNGNSSTCTATATVQDNVNPNAQCRNVTVQLNSSGNGSTTAAAINNGSSDACGVNSLSISPSSFTCNNVGANTVTLTVTDVNGNSSTCTATATVQDNVNPNAQCQNVTVQLNSSGNGSTTAGAVNNGSSDACGIASLSINPSSFTCSNVGANTVTLTVTDVNGNSSTCTATATVQDNVNPSAQCQDVTVQLNSSGNGSTTAGAVNNGSNDACGIASMSLSPSSFNCSNVGANTVTLTVTDNNGNSSSCTATATVEDNVNPNAQCQNVTVQLDVEGNGSTSAGAVNNGSSDACGISNLALSPSSFTCSNVGANTVTLTVTDVNGNSSTCTATATVEDNVNPEALCQDVTVQLNINGDGSTSTGDVNNGSSDACGIASMSLDNEDFTCADVGSGNTVTLTDNNGNSSTCTSTVTVEDNVNPVALCQDVTVQLDVNGDGSTSTGDVNNGSSDACGIASMSLDNEDFTCADVGSGNTVTLTVTDNNGNSSTCTSTVTVEDNVNPEALCKSISVTLDTTGNYSILADDIDVGSNDACGILSTSVAPNAFTCDNLGSNTVTLTVTDNNGNVSTCITTVTVLGIVPVVTITEAELPLFCQGGTIVLTANSDVPVQFYGWSTGETTQDIQINADGDYTVDVTSWTGCVTTVTYNISGFDAGSLISAYTIIGMKEVHLHGENALLNGAVGVLNANKKVKLHDNSYVNSFIQAPIIEIDGSSSAGGTIFAPADITLPPFINNPYDSDNDVTVDDNDTVVLTDCIFDKLEIKKNATVTFTCDNIFIHELKTKEGVTIIFTGSSNVFINKKVKFEKNSMVNPSGESVTMYIDDKVEVKEGSNIHANLYTSTHDIHAHGKDSNPITMTGIFIGDKIHGNKSVNWNWDTNCNPAELPEFPEPPCDECKGGVVELELQYNGIQDELITVTNKDGDVTYFEGVVAAGGTFSFVGDGPENKLDKDTKVYIKGDLDVTIHTSCSKPIGPDAVWGSFTVVSAVSKDNGEVCPSECECRGGVVELELQYNGTQDAQIKVTDKDGDDVYFEGPVVVGGTFSFVGEGNDNKLDKDTKVYIDDELDVTLHTSCSQPIGPGAVWGTFTVISSASKDGGVCSDEPILLRSTALSIESTVYPNPFSDRVNISFAITDNSPVKIDIIGLDGTVVHRVELGILEAELTHTYEFKPNQDVSSGTYIYRIISGSGLTTGQIILIK